MFLIDLLNRIAIMIHKKYQDGWAGNLIQGEGAPDTTISLNMVENVQFFKRDIFEVR
jgi:hypothetical protein